MTSQLLDENPAADEWYGADDAPGTGPAAEPPPSTDAPFGWMRDKDTPSGWRAKKAPGRPRKPPAPDELAAAAPVGHAADEPPAPPRRSLFGAVRSPAAAAEVPMPRGGLIATGVDRLYRRAGKILRILDDDLGLAVIECTRPDPDDPDMPTVGQAWETLARANPRVRAWLLNLIKGGTWQDLLMAHAPIGIALMTKTWVQQIIPLGRAADILLEPDEDTEDGDLLPADAHDMQALAEAQAHRIAGKLGVKVPPGIAAEALRQAEERAAAGHAPPGLRRQQPARNSRAKRRGK